MDEGSAPKYWPSKFVYTPLPFSDEIHPNLLQHLLFTGKEEDRETVHPLIESKSVHPHLQVKRITDPNHILINQYGLFATQDIPEGSELGTFGGKIRLIPKGWQQAPEKCDYALVMDLAAFTYVIDGKYFANEMVLMNDYRNIKDAPNVKATSVIHRGLSYPMFITIAKISQGDELLWDYGQGYWQNR